MAEVLTPIVVIALLILLNGLFVAAEFAMVAARRARLESAGGTGGWAVRYVGGILSSTLGQDRYIAIAQLGITLATIGLGMYGEPSIAGWLYGPLESAFGLGEPAAHVLGTIVAVLVMTYFHVVVGEMIPKALALREPERTALAVARPMRITGVVFYPLVALLNGTGALLLRLLGIPAGGDSRIYSPSELAFLVEESHDEGALSDQEERLIRNILDFGEREVRQVMVPRLRTRGIRLAASVEEIREIIRTSGHSRYPVYRKTLDEIEGILHVKDFIAREIAGETVDLPALLRRAPSVPETMPVERLLARLKRNGVHMAVVVDEFGGTSGIVTLEDLLEEVVGEVEDEFDPDGRPEFEELPDGGLLVDGGLALHRFNEHMGTGLESRGSTTIAGYVLERLQRVPRPGDELEVGRLRIVVRELDGLAIRSLLVERTSGSASQRGGPETDESSDGPPEG